ncbi:hypothetical protein [Spongiactinospora sp. TRM90649]|uniref:hypothetical protein n=1 Tax=Spongiactinospora sp. TRM90649 TaxID=3031114 RepID=UPI0023F6792B|nr:hypothetical protein [Spongiactinospora sp. TRM90649]MDF5755728.1 hypothetical protein [Spongiactinospora sp. TRM90649]
MRADPVDVIPQIGADGGPADASVSPVPSRVRARIADPATPRRTLLKGLLVAALAATLAPFEWYLTRREARAARGPASEWTSSNCSDAYPEGYTEAPANWFSGPAVCYGGWRIGSYPCNDSKWHFEGYRSNTDVGEEYMSLRTDSFCGTTGARNAWRWTAAGSVYRCSDAVTEVTWNDGDSYRGLTIAMCAV